MKLTWPNFSKESARRGTHPLMASAATEDNQIGHPKSTCSPAICCTLSILLIIGILSSTPHVTVTRRWSWLFVASEWLLLSSVATMTDPLIACDDESTIRGTEPSLPLALSDSAVETEGATSCTEDLFDSFSFSFSFSYSSTLSLFEESFEQMHPIFLQKGCCFVSPINQ